GEIRYGRHSLGAAQIRRFEQYMDQGRLLLCPRGERPGDWNDRSRRGQPAARSRAKGRIVWICSASGVSRARRAIFEQSLQDRRARRFWAVDALSDQPHGRFLGIARLLALLV